MRTRWLLVATLLLSACSDDPEPRPASPAPPRATTTTATPGPTPSPTPAAQAVRLVGDGIETPAQVATFGMTFEQVQPALVAALGPPTKDTGLGSSSSDYGTCPGTRLRALEFGGGALSVLFGDVIGPGITMYQWTLSDRGRPAEVPRASALVGDVTTYEFGVGDSVGEIRAGVAGGAELELVPGDEVVAPSFRLTDQSSGFFGSLTGTGDGDTALSVQAGESCGE